MMNREVITSVQNPQVKRFASLNERKHRRREGLFLIEGEKEIRHAIDGGVVFDTVCFCESLLSGNSVLTSPQSLQDAFHSSVRFLPVDERVFTKLAYRDTVGGIVAVAKIPEDTIKRLDALTDKPLLLIVQGVEKPGNLGALLRTADGAGVDAVIVCDGQADLYNPNVVRASLGALFTVPTCVMELAELKGWLSDRNITMVMTTPQAECDYAAVDYTLAVAIVLGSEKDGLPQSWLSGDVQQIRIPMLGQMDSLNVSVSGAIVLYEAQRQRLVAKS